MSDFIWKTVDGRRIPINKLGYDHLVNIIKKMLRMGVDVPKEIKKEAKNRGINIKELKNGIGGHTKTISKLMARVEELEKRIEKLERWEEV